MFSGYYKNINKKGSTLKYYEEIFRLCFKLYSKLYIYLDFLRFSLILKLVFKVLSILYSFYDISSYFFLHFFKTLYILHAFI